MFLFEQTLTSFSMEFYLSQQNKTPDLCDPGHSSGHQSDFPPLELHEAGRRNPLGAFPAWNPLVLSGATRPPGTTGHKAGQDPFPSGCLAKRIHVEVWWSSKSSAQHWGGLWQPPSRALMDEDLADP